MSYFDRSIPFIRISIASIFLNHAKVRFFVFNGDELNVFKTFKKSQKH